MSIFSRLRSKLFKLSNHLMDQQERCKKCNIKCGLIKVSPDVLRSLEDGFQKLSGSNSTSLLKKYLTKQVFDELKQKKTSFGSTLLDCIQSGLVNHDSGVGIYAPDPEAYVVFASLFNSIIQDYHGGFGPEDKHPKLDWGDISNLEDLDPNGEHIISTRVRCGRSIEGYPFNPCLTEDNYMEIEEQMIKIFRTMEGELEGEYKDLTTMSKEEQNQLIDDHFLFKEGDRFLKAANACRFWPKGRGIYMNHNKTFLVWVNEEDHLRIISMQPGGDMASVYKRMIEGVYYLEQNIKFARSPRFGFLTFCPTNLVKFSRYNN
ncbi:arginine kinase-like isoform X2 [Harmonia axyridis]|uniref:arginine kinase-like isoform X2 n=1 Tax=Harmonia axyridis TaxID=115357 RepID=UPI001E2786A7|nr:arginine kinase-like isoform X2 [Harmonia axyridis]